MPVRLFILSLILCLATSCHSSKDITSQQPNRKQPQISENMPPGEVSLFDGRSLGQWKITDFDDPGKVYVRNETIILEFGNNLTGVTWSGPVLRTNYEINLDAMRVDGDDFFCGLTFPVAHSFVTFIVGGWAGTVCGISCINYYDASDNETTVKGYFDYNRWYHIRVRVTPDRIQCWIDDEQYVDLETTGKHLDVRTEVKKSRPLGIASWRTAAAIKNIRLTRLPDTPPSRRATDHEPRITSHGLSPAPSVICVKKTIEIYFRGIIIIISLEARYINMDRRFAAGGLI